MTIHIEKYSAPPEFIDAVLELMNKLSNDIHRKTEATEGTCALVAITVLQGLIDAMKAELNIGVMEDDNEETKH